MSSIFERNKKDYDGTLVCHVLDYYFPEWSKIDGRIKTLAYGKTSDRYDVGIYISKDRASVLRIEIDDYQYARIVVGLSLSSEKEFIKKLWKKDDSFDIEKTDKRFLVMMEDFK